VGFLGVSGFFFARGIERRNNRTSLRADRTLARREGFRRRSWSL
jgi:hypothetical protein